MSNNGWRTVKFGDVVDVKQGLCFNKQNNHLLREKGIPVLLIKDLKNNTVSQYTDEELTPSKFISKPTDIIYTRTGQVGLVFTNKVGVVHNNSFRVIPNEEIFPLYLYWYLRQKSIIKHANNIAGGSAQPDLGHDAFKSIPFSYPEIQIQEKIVDILSNYEVLIENNKDRINSLEESAQRLYQEWFVKFRFPGHENVPMVDSELGPIPEGWKVVKVGTKFQVVLGGTPSRKIEEYWGGDIPWINSSMTNELRVLNPSERITKQGLKKSATKMMPKRSTVLAITGATLGQVSLLEIEACANQSVVGIWDSTNTYNEYIYLKFCEVIQEVINRASGGAQQHINKEIVNQTKIVIPNENIGADFGKQIGTIFDKMASLLEMNQQLRAARDLLLPKLISGQLDVSELDIATEEMVTA